MCKRHTLADLLLLLVITLVASTQPSLASVPDNGSSAHGSGQFSFFGVWHFSFEAFGNKKGHAHGRAMFENLSEETQVEVRIDCLSVRGSTAVMSGTVLHSDNPDFPKSTNVFFVADDGSPTSSDIITPLFVGGEDCQNAALPLTFFSFLEMRSQSNRN